MECSVAAWDRASVTWGVMAELVTPVREKVLSKSPSVVLSKQKEICMYRRCDVMRYY